MTEATAEGSRAAELAEAAEKNAIALKHGWGAEGGMRTREVKAGGAEGGGEAAVEIEETPGAARVRSTGAGLLIPGRRNGKGQE
jgi:hypothetical protein